MKKLSSNQSRHSTLLAFAALGATLLTSCAKDRTVDDYKREKLREDLGQIQAAAGIYRGVLYSNSNHTALGAVELSLEASTRAESAKDGLKAGSSPVLLGGLRLFGNRLMSIKIKDASYDPDTGRYQANVPVKQQNGDTTEVVVSGTIVDNHFKGSIEAYNYHENGGTVDLERDASLPQNISGNLGKDGSEPLPPEADNTALGSFTGTTTFIGSGISRPVSLVILSPKRSSDEELLNFFLPVRNVQVTFNYGNSFQILHNVEWNQQNGRLIGEASLLVNQKAVNVSLRCDKAEVSGLDGLECQTYTTSLGRIARTQVTPSNAHSALPGQGGNTDSVSLQYQGEAQLLDGSAIPVTMTASYPSRSREQEILDLYFPPAEKLLVVTIKFFDKGIAATFANSRWDLRSHALNGETLSGIGAPGSSQNTGSQYNLSINCTNYQFDGKQDDFDCFYFSNQLGAPIVMKLHRQTTSGQGR